MKKLTFIFCLILSFLTLRSNAYAVLTNDGVLDSITTRFYTAVAGWGTAIYDAADYLFWILVAISMVWTFGFMAMRKADIGEFFAEFLKFIIFVGFFRWLLVNGTAYASDIILSLRTIGANAAGVPNALTPSGIVDVGFQICFAVIDNSSLWNPVDTAVALVLGIVICVVLALIAVNMVVLLCSSWFLLYGGIFFLGFGGSRWTCDMAINYYKTVLKIAIQLFAMILLVGTGQTLLNEYHALMSASLPFKELVVMLIVAIVLLLLVNKIPELLASVVTGGMGTIPGGGQYGAGAAMAAVAMGASAIATGGAAIAGGAGAIKSAIAAAGSSGGGSSLAGAAANIGQSFSNFASDGGGIGGGSAGDEGFFGGGSNEATPTDSNEGGQTLGNSIGPGSNEDSGFNSVSSESSEKVAEQAEQPSSNSSSNDDSNETAQKVVSTSAPAFAANVMRNLASGTNDVMKEKVDNRVSQTTGGQVAEAIKRRVSEGRAWSNRPSPPSEDEISNFVNKKG